MSLLCLAGASKYRSFVKFSPFSKRFLSVNSRFVEPKRFTALGGKQIIRAFHSSPIYFDSNNTSEDVQEKVQPEDISLKDFPQSRIRNFSVIAHIDHGKTSISNRLLEITKTIQSSRDYSLDKLQVEQERGITVKAHTTSMFYKYKGEVYLLNLIDTPGHVDFNYEVSRSLSASQGALLVVDASKGVQAQTVANFYLALENSLDIIPVVNKIDLPSATVENAILQMNTTFEFKKEDMLFVSAKTGQGIDTLLPAVIERIPSPKGNENGPLKALLFDSWYDKFRGAICLVRIIDGTMKKGDRILSGSSKKEYEILDLGILYPNPISCPSLHAGQVGWIVCGMKTTKEARVGDTFMKVGEEVPMLPGFKPITPMVFAGLYPVEQNDYERMKESIQKLTLNDAGVTIQTESSDALGLGFRCGFLGVLHMEVFMQRLSNEFGIEALATAPTVPYKVISRGKETIISSPSEFGSSHHDEVMEPMIVANIIAPSTYLSGILKLCMERRGEQIEMKYLDDQRILFTYKLPLAETIFNFYDRLKEITSGFASFEYTDGGYASTSISKVDILLNGEPVGPLSFLVHKSQVEVRAREVVSKLVEYVERQQFSVPIQAAVGSKVIARETLSALRKNVTAKCYGGDVTRKRKLLEKQKEGKKKMKEIGSVSLAKEAFIAILKTK